MKTLGYIIGFLMGLVISLLILVQEHLRLEVQHFEITVNMPEPTPPSGVYRLDAKTADCTKYTNDDGWTMTYTNDKDAEEWRWLFDHVPPTADKSPSRNGVSVKK